MVHYVSAQAEQYKGVETSLHNLCLATLQSFYCRYYHFLDWGFSVVNRVVLQVDIKIKSLQQSRLSIANNAVLLIPYAKICFIPRCLHLVWGPAINPTNDGLIDKLLPIWSGRELDKEEILEILEESEGNNDKGRIFMSANKKTIIHTCLPIF